MQPFVGLDDLSDALGEDVTTSDLAVIAIDSACQMVRDHLGNSVNLVEDHAIALDGTGRPRLILPEGPVREVSEVVLDDEELDAEDYVLENGATWTGMFLRRVGTTTTQPVWTEGLGNVEITYSHGWDVEEPASEPPEDFERVPSSIRKVALGLASRIYRNNGEGSGGGATTSLRLGSAAETFDAGAAAQMSSTDLQDDELTTLKPYLALRFR